jgi:exonuclease III
MIVVFSRGELRDDTKQYREDKALIDLVMRQKPLSRYRAFWACADIKRAGCGVLVKKDVEAPKSVTRSLVSRVKKDAHEEGRVLLLEFSSVQFLNVYAQNNGWTKESMAKRRAWDDELRRFLCHESRALDAKDGGAKETSFPVVSRPKRTDGSRKPLIWCGDLNACHKEVDVSHPAFFAAAKAEGKNGKAPVELPADPDDRGQPGFTANERKRFDALVTDAKLVDAYRELHGDAEMRMTWFGHPGVTQVGKYRGRGMRLDYFFVDGGDWFRENVESCVQATDGIPVAELAERPDRAFFGSDHCAVLLRLKSGGGGTTSESR